MADPRETCADREPPEYLIVGEIVAPFGHRGEVKVLLDTDFPELVLDAVYLYVGEPPVRRTVEWARPHQGMVRLKLAGCDDRRAAEALRGAWLQVRTAEAPLPGEGEYYYYQLIGLRVYSDAAEDLGQVEEVLPTGSNEVLVVRGPQGELLLPMTAEVVLAIDLDAGCMRVHLLEGLR